MFLIHHLQIDVTPMFLVQMIGRTYSLILFPKLLAHFRIQLEGTGRLGGFQPYMQEDFSSYAEDELVRAIRHVLRGTIQRQGKLPYLFDVH